MKEKVEVWQKKCREGAGAKLRSHAKSLLMSYQKDDLISLLNCYSRNVRGFPFALSTRLFVFRGVYGRKVAGEVEGQLKSGSRPRRLD